MNSFPSLSMRLIGVGLFLAALLLFAVLVKPHNALAADAFLQSAVEYYAAQQGGYIPVSGNNWMTNTSIPASSLAGMVPGSNASDLMCTPVDVTCPCNMTRNSLGKCAPGVNKFMCPGSCVDVTNKFTTTGICISLLKCKGLSAVDAAGNAVPLSQVAGESGSFVDKALGFVKENPLISSIGLGAGMSLLQSMMSGGGGGGSGGSGSYGGYGGYGTGICMTQYYYSANPSPTDPCAIYSPTGSGSTLPTSGANDTDLMDLINGINPNPNGSPSRSIVDVINGAQCPIISTLVSCASGDILEEQGLDTNGCRREPICTHATSSSMDSGGANLTPSTSGTVVPVANLISNQDLYRDGTSNSTPYPSQTPLNQRPVPIPSGLHGDLLSFGGGVTIFARSRTGNTEISGFYGGSSSSSLCQRRPWSTNFLSYIIPPAFFDNLCKWGGFGQSTGGLSSGTGGLQSGTRNVTGPRTPSTPVGPAQSDLVPEAHIRASPETVNLGGRTTVFWTSRNVASCEESSSDGNFHGTTAAGGASTVSLSGSVTFYIDCLGLSGERATDSFTVRIGI